MTVGERIKYVRESSGISQTDLATAIGISKQSLYKYENNIVTNIPSDKIEAIARITKSSPAFLMGWEPEYKAVISTDIKQTKLINNYLNLNETGRKKLFEYSEDLVTSGNYEISNQKEKHA